jgi:uncharacterized protein
LRSGAAVTTIIIDTDWRTEMAEFDGRFCWYELMTSDRNAARTFYGAVVGWSTEEASTPGQVYSMLTAAARPIGGLMELPEDCRRLGIPPRWTGYVAVGDLEAATTLATRLGATTRVPPTDIPNVGRFSIITDPQGAMLALFQAAKPNQEPPLEISMPGGIGWHELWAADWEAAFDFYAKLFGWQKAEAMDTGEMGTYQLFAVNGTPVGGMVNKPPAIPAFWLYYFNVDDIDAAAKRVADGGGRVTNGPMAVPGGGWIIHAIDPQGAQFALFGKRGNDREFVISRVFDSPRETVFQAWTDAGRLAGWWGPKGFTNPVCEIDPRPGGAYRIVMRSPEGVDYPVKGVYREVVRPERLVMTDDCSEHPKEWLDQVNPDRPEGEGPPALEALSTVTFSDEGGRTRLTISTLFASVAIRDSMVKMGMEEGWSQSLDRLADLLAGR